MMVALFLRGCWGRQDLLHHLAVSILVLDLWAFTVIMSGNLTLLETIIVRLNNSNYFHFFRCVGILVVVCLLDNDGPTVIFVSELVLVGLLPDLLD